MSRQSHFALLCALFIMMLALSGCNAIFGKPLPQGHAGKDADQLANSMLEALDYEAWTNTRYVRWSLFSRHFLWDKERNFVQVEWRNHRALLNFDSGDGHVFKKGVPLESSQLEKALDKARNAFYNDSFWLEAPFKVFDDGTVRAIVPQEGDQKALLVTYTQGGDTPGDSYLWLLDENHRPYAFRMWVSIIPIGGLQAEWSNWIALPTNARIATERKISFYRFSIKDLMAGNSLSEVGITNDPFASFSPDGNQ